jgi:hypothetical protein
MAEATNKGTDYVKVSLQKMIPTNSCTITARVNGFQHLWSKSKMDGFDSSNQKADHTTV